MSSEEVVAADSLLRENAELRADRDWWRVQAQDTLVQLHEVERERDALRALDHLDQALSTMSVVEIDSLQARVNDTLVPELARMLAILLIKEDGELYNVITWALGATEMPSTEDTDMRKEQSK